MSVFDAYAAYYDLLYRDKDYAAEAAYVDGLIRRHTCGARELLELGCGTGGHALELSALGHRVTGIDLSPAMIERARVRGGRRSGQTLEFLEGDLRTFRSGQQFDVILALFHVMSYQTANSDIAAAMETAAFHLSPGGIFIFDCWFGPAVISDPPAVRVKRLGGDGVHITRLAEPALHANENRVDVHYEIIVEGPAGLERVRETHSMRYLFTPEVDQYLERVAMHRIAAEEWMSGTALTLGSWNACFVAQR